MVVKDAFTKILMDKLIQNVISCSPIIEKMVKEQDKEIKEKTSVVNKRDFVIGAIWCVILEKYLVSSYLNTGKTISYEQGLQASEYVLDKISNIKVTIE